jgi:hypothetical protein
MEESGLSGPPHSDDRRRLALLIHTPVHPSWSLCRNPAGQGSGKLLSEVLAEDRGKVIGHRHILLMKRRISSKILLLIRSIQLLVHQSLRL